MAQDHAHDHTTGANERALTTALVLTGGFMTVELVAALMTGSLALLSDAGHMFTDTAGLAMALVAIRIGKRRADDRRTYGYKRFEVLAAAANAVVLIALALYVCVEGARRLFRPIEIDAPWMMAVAAVGLVVNLLSMRVLRAGSEESLNVKGAYLEVWADMIGSAAVLVAGAVIWFTDWRQVDPLLAIATSLWMLPRSWTLLKDATHILLAGVPASFDMPGVRAAMLAFPGVRDVHDLHASAISSDQIIVTAHVRAEPSAFAAAGGVRALTEAVRTRARNAHLTIQVEDEDEPCAEELGEGGNGAERGHGH